jgi:methyltransferase (TIGR00027 family)
MDFTRDRLDEVLARAGHDASRPTTFVWEGVTMYLSREDLEATLRAIATRSAAQSCLVATYRDAPQRSVEAVLDVAVRFVGEPFRTRLSPPDMRDLLRPHGFRVEHDEGSDTWSERYLGEHGRPTSERLVVARHA